MSWEVWGTPPDPEPQYCPQCGEQSHVEGCELGAMQVRAATAETQLLLLRAEVERLQGELKARHQRQHDAEALAGEYLMQRDDARRLLAALVQSGAGQQTLANIKYNGIGTDTDEGRAWLEAGRLSNPAPARSNT